MQNDKPMNRAAELDEDEVAELGFVLKPRPRTPVELLIPDDVLAALQEIAKQEGISVESLLKSYISSGLRADKERRRAI